MSTEDLAELAQAVAELAEEVRGLHGEIEQVLGSTIDDEAVVTR